MVHWVNASNGQIPSNAVPLGHDANGPLFVARATIPGGGFQLGKIGKTFGAAYIPYGGSEVPVASYQVLAGSSDEAKSGSPAYPTAFAPYGQYGPAPAPQWATPFPDVYAPRQRVHSGFVPPAFGALPDQAVLQYISASQGTPTAPILEFSAIACGYEQDMTPLFCALVEYKGGLHPGKVRLGFGGANISWGGAEIAGLSPYSVLCDASYGFIAAGAQPGNVPDGTFSCGMDDDGAPLYFARLYSAYGLQIGKVSPEYSAQIGFADAMEQTAKNYAVMCAANTIPSANFPTANESDGRIPDGAVVLGCEADGTPLFGALTGGFYPGTGPWPSSPRVTQLGKVRNGFGGARIPYKGQEVTTTSYAVLCAGGYQGLPWPT